MSSLTGRRKTYQQLAMASAIAIFLLIIIGGTVRITGSGMGCPDWPKCFGKYVPPTNISVLPSDYQAMYAKKGYAADGFPLMTWIEYINRLWSVIIVGPLLLFAFAFSFTWWKQDKMFAIMNCAILFLTGFEAWLGKLVVEKHLENLSVSIHMIPAMLILALSISAFTRTFRYTAIKNGQGSKALVYSMLAVLGILLVQVLTGTFVRSEFDSIAKRIDNRALWVNEATHYLPGHQLTALLVSAGCILLAIQMLKLGKTNNVYKYSAIALIASISGQLITGILLTYFSFPSVAQLLHLLFSMSIFAAIVYALSYKLATVKALTDRNVNNVYFA